MPSFPAAAAVIILSAFATSTSCISDSLIVYEFRPRSADCLCVPRIRLHDPPILAGRRLVHELPTVKLDPAHILIAHPDVDVRGSNMFSLVFTTNRNCPSIATVGMGYQRYHCITSVSETIHLSSYNKQHPLAFLTP